MTAALFDDAGEAANYDAYRIRQMQEYGTWVAATQIFVEGVLAFNPRTPVPASTVAKFGWNKQGLVVPADTPPPDPAQILAAQKRQRLAELDAERALLAADLGEDPDAEQGEQTAAPSESDSPAPGASRGRGTKSKE